MILRVHSGTNILAFKQHKWTSAVFSMNRPYSSFYNDTSFSYSLFNFVYCSENWDFAITCSLTTRDLRINKNINVIEKTWFNQEEDLQKAYYDARMKENYKRLFSETNFAKDY